MRPVVESFFAAAAKLSGIDSALLDPRDDATPVAIARQAGLDQNAIDQAMAEATGIRTESDLAAYSASASFVEKIPISFAREHLVLALASDNTELPVAIGSLTAVPQLDVLFRLLGKPIQPLLCPKEIVLAAINAAYQERTGQAQVMIEKLDRKDVLQQVRQLQGREDLLDVSSRAPVIKLVNLMLFEAVQSRASDVHIQPYEENLFIRLRVDGILFDAFEVPKALQEEIVSRIKVMGKMNIAEKRLPQDGRATVQVGERTIDLRIASLPTTFGERVVIRLLDKGSRLLGLSELGMGDGTTERFRKLISAEHGIILVTGPTGSGKTTTLYAALREINAKEKNILTLEDPIEYRLEGISQTQVSEKKGMSFASGLRNVLRQDPDVIMVGEIRDRETAVMAIQSALTGHLVFSTLHTNDAASAITRLLDLGIEPYLLASSMIGVLAQRLVRRVCPKCGMAVTSPDTELSRLGQTERTTAGTVRHGQGCETCRNSGYFGRLGIFELLGINEQIREHIQNRSTAAQIKSAAFEAGMSSLRDDGRTKILAGITTVDEVLRVTMLENV